MMLGARAETPKDISLSIKVLLMKPIEWFLKLTSCKLFRSIEDSTYVMPDGFWKRDPIPKENICLDCDVFEGCWLGCKLDIDLLSKALLARVPDLS